MPDGTYPNSSVVKEILTALMQLHIDTESLENSQGLAKLVNQYAHGVQGQSPGI